jgi:flavin reductase (DIM6/NTAB) family NADH-FMN oxidoreductase RutF
MMILQDDEDPSLNIQRGTALAIDHFPVSPQAMREVMRLWATGVAVVSSHHHGVRHGMTVSSFTSISLEPPLVLVSLSKEARTHDLVQRSGVFGVTLLDQSQQWISERFAGRTSEDQDRFSGLQTFVLHTGAAFLQGGLSFLDCKVVTGQDAGDNTLFIGQVVDLKTGTGGDPLIYYDRDYHRLMGDKPA